MGSDARQLRQSGCVMGARQDLIARLEQALAAYSEAPYGDCCDPGFHGREPMPKTPTDYQLRSLFVSPKVTSKSRGYGVYLRRGMSKLKPSLLGWVDLACHGSCPINVFAELIPFCGEEIDEILDGELSMPGSHGRYLKGVVSGGFRARTGPRLTIFRSQLIGLRGLTASISSLAYLRNWIS